MIAMEIFFSREQKIKWVFVKLSLATVMMISFMYSTRKLEKKCHILSGGGGVFFTRTKLLNCPFELQSESILVQSLAFLGSCSLQTQLPKFIEMQQLQQQYFWGFSFFFFFFFSVGKDHYFSFFGIILKKKKFFLLKKNGAGLNNSF